ncbi:auxin efflux carrier superfamily like protein [Zymoseptoria brevis]|uniref:Auxin efflux carrier superfamily like protein n=1 Tax=Zymoseptoria brevis TaxID=1047168 RepID=A0A0F4GWJ0_9PEZI|nr:auxin efflux carrier superfamily like protein [Zymoseptoria brevis]
MPFFDFPQSMRVRNLASASLIAFKQRRQTSLVDPLSLDAQFPIWDAVTNATMSAAANHDSHPDFLNLAGLVSEAVLEVVFVALPGFLVAITGMFDANSQKFVAELNTMVFTPCLIFTKLASQLNADKLADLVVIPFIFAAQTLVSFACAQLMAWAFGFGKKHKQMQKNFVLAMGVFGNSNSLPISLVLSLSKTIAGLHWDQIPGDNDDEVAARGILYLLIFQQLGQLLRWTWGYSVLLRPASEYEDDQRRDLEEEDRSIEEGPYTDDPYSPTTKLIGNGHDSGFNSGTDTPSPPLSRSSQSGIGATPGNGNDISTEPRNLTHHDDSDDDLAQFPNFSRNNSINKAPQTKETTGWKAPLYRVKNSATRTGRRVSSTLSTFFSNLFRRLPTPVQKVLKTFHYYNSKFWAGVWRQMNPPLWAMLAALIVASVPDLQHLFFSKGTLISNSVTRAIQQSGNVAVPLILVVLGANLARSTLPQDQLATTKEEKKEERKLLYASLLSRMVLPVIIMAPVLALTAKFIPVSILDDPIFIIVCFLLTGAPSALQLAQICQINGVFMGAMSSLLVASYVVVIFPSTLLLVLMALEVLEWAVI